MFFFFFLNRVTFRCVPCDANNKPLQGVLGLPCCRRETEEQKVPQSYRRREATFKMKERIPRTSAGWCRQWWCLRRLRECGTWGGEEGDKEKKKGTCNLCLMTTIELRAFGKVVHPPGAQTLLRCCSF